MLIVRGREKRRTTRHSATPLVAMTIAGLIGTSTTTISRAFVRAAFSSPAVGRAAARSSSSIAVPHGAFVVVDDGCGRRRVVDHRHRAAALHAVPPPSSSSSSSMSMSTAAAETETEADQDLDRALDEILGEAFLEAENPKVDSRVDVGGTARGHIEGSRAFPKDLMVEEVRCVGFFVFSICVSSSLRLFGPILFFNSSDAFTIYSD